VVASEVKNLAKQATDRIAGEISALNGISGEVVNALHTIKDAIQAVGSYVTSTAVAIDEQSAVTSTNVGQHAARGGGSVQHRGSRGCLIQPRPCGFRLGKPTPTGAKAIAPKLRRNEASARQPALWHGLAEPKPAGRRLVTSGGLRLRPARSA
jgi:hypothetical protein